MKNDGWNSQEYSLVDDEQSNAHLPQVLNELCHVFHCHADGNWQEYYKPKYVKLLAVVIKEKPYLIRKLLNLKDRVISSVTYAAVEYNDNEKA